jgi:hypothetical protein
MNVHKLIQPELVGLVHSSNVTALDKLITFIASPLSYKDKASLCHSMSDLLHNMMDNLKTEIQP